MSATNSLLDSFKPTDNPALNIRARLSEVDSSMRVPAVLFIVSAVLWLLAGTVFALLAALGFHPAEAMQVAKYQMGTVGIMRTAHLNAMIYGWSSNVAFAVAPWMMGRLCKTRIRHTPILLTAGVFYNIGVTLGIIGILRGDMNGVEWLEMPTYATPLIAIAFALCGVWVILAFRWRQTNHIYVSQWYILAAFFWLPWLYTIAQIMILIVPVRGVVQSLTNWWFAHNVLGLWLTPIALATAYYLIPKVLGRPIYSYYLSVIGFWTLALFYNWAGVHHLIGGPVPAWVISAGTVASIMMVIPVIVTAINHHMTVVGLHRAGWASPTIRFVVFGAVNYTIVSLIGSTMALRSVSEITHFTHFTVGHAHHGVYAFYTMIMFGAVYYMMPRLLLREWPSAFLIRTHWWMCSIGITLMIVVLSIAGWKQGLMLNKIVVEDDLRVTAHAFSEVVKMTRPYLVARSFSGLLLTLGHLAFAVSVFWMLFLPKRSDENSKPTLLDSAKS